MERAAEMHQQWADAFASIGYSHISTDTAANQRECGWAAKLFKEKYNFKNLMI